MNSDVKSQRGSAAQPAGQALTEFAVALVGLMAVMLIVIFISGVGIANIQTLTEARYSAERRGAGTAGWRPSGGQDIKGWIYDGIVPFTPRDRAVRSGLGDGAMAESEQGLNGLGWSEPWPENRYFVPVGLDDLPEYLPSDRAVSGLLRTRPVNFAAAALLVAGAGSGETDQFYEDRWDERLKRSFHYSFGKWFGMRINRLDLRDQRANIVYFPARDEPMQP